MEWAESKNRGRCGRVSQDSCSTRVQYLAASLRGPSDLLQQDLHIVQIDDGFSLHMLCMYVVMVVDSMME